MGLFENPELILQTAISGLLAGGIYALVAVGLSFVFGVMRVINIAHGSFVMVGMYASYVLFRFVGIDPYLSIIIVAPLLFVIGWIAQRTILEPILKADTAREPFAALLVTFGLWLILENTALMMFGAEFVPLNAPYRDSAITFGEIVISLPRLVAFLVALAVTAMFWAFLARTYMGRALRAVGQDRAVARLMGINDNRLYAAALGISAAIAGTAGALIAPVLFINPAIGEIFFLRAFIIVILGGIGSIPGALIAGLAFGLLESLISLFSTLSVAQIALYGLFIVVLVVRPRGLLGLEKE